MKFINTVREILEKNSLHSNSIFLMTAQGVVTFFGYIFWVLVARLYSSNDVGFAVTLISIATLISQISILGLNNSIVRYLPGSKQKNETINIALWLVSITSFVVSIAYILCIPLLSPKLLFVRQDWVFLLIFIAAMILVTLNTFTDSIFLANRATRYNVIIYGAFSILRLILPIAFISLGVLGIIMAHVIGVALAVFLSFY